MQMRNGCSESPCNLCKVTQLVSSRARIPAEVWLIVKSPWETNTHRCPKFGDSANIGLLYYLYYLQLHHNVVWFLLSSPNCSVKLNSVFLKGCPQAQALPGTAAKAARGKILTICIRFSTYRTCSRTLPALGKIVVMFACTW